MESGRDAGGGCKGGTKSPSPSAVEAMSYLSPLPHYPAPSTRLRRSVSYLDLAPSTHVQAEWDLHRHRLLHPLYSDPQRHYHLANGRQRMHQDVTTIPYLVSLIQKQCTICLAPSQSSRPRVDPAALQHAAARLRKTQYNQPIRSDVPNLSDGRVDGPHQQLPDRDWSHGSQQRQLECHAPREEIHAAPTHLSQPGSFGDVRRPANSLDSSPNTVTQTYNTTPRVSYDANSFDATPKSLFKTFNNPSSDSFIDRTLSTEPPSSYSYSYSSSTVSNTAPTATAPSVTRSSFSSSSTKTTTNETSYPSGPSPNIPTIQPYRNGVSPNRTTTPTSNNTARPYSPQGKTTTVQWTEPYIQGQSNTITDPRSLIRDFATNTYVQEDKTILRTPSPLARQPSPSGRQPIVSRHDQFARQLRDEGLTSSQKAANQQSRSPLRREELPFDTTRLYQGSYRGDEVDHLVQKMSTQMRTNVMQSSNICVACKSPITSDAPGCTALDQIFHIACFKCCRCSKVLAGSSFYNIEAEPICEGCYQDTLEKCTKCGKTIADKLLRACGGTYHVDCFACHNCGKTLDGIPFTTDSEQNVHCVPCFHDKFAPRCAMCSQAIIPTEGAKESVRVVAMNKSFHVECYRCEDCGLQLSSKVEGQGCYPLDNHLYCKTCNSNRLRMMASTA